jgi:hypothetical protein
LHPPRSGRRISRRRLGATPTTYHVGRITFATSIMRQEVAVEPEQSQSETANGTADETFNPWSVVNLVFHHLAGQGLHPTLGVGGDPGTPAAELLRCLGIAPAAEGNRHVADKVQDRLAELRGAVFGESEHRS